LRKRGINQLRPLTVSLIVRQHDFKVSPAGETWRSTVKAAIWTLWVLCLLPMELSAWTNGRLLVWMDSERAKGASDRQKV
jgi:hypothetical protein